jgi:iron complex outermembrane receptor protein
MQRLHGLSSLSLGIALARRCRLPHLPARQALDCASLHSMSRSGDLRAGLSAIRAPAACRSSCRRPPRGSSRLPAYRASTARAKRLILLRGTGLKPHGHGGMVVLKPGPMPRRAAIMPVAQTIEAPIPPLIGLAAATRATQPDIVVSGYRQSLKLAQDYKRRAVGSQDDILAQDIAAFPDLNLAESLQRVPGITITRDSGEGRQITLRGLGADFTRTQLNGMEVLGNTASGMDNRGASADRARSISACSPPNCSTASRSRNPMRPSRMKAASPAPSSSIPPSRSTMMAPSSSSRPRGRPTPTPAA